MPTLEERVARLETFMGDIDKITSVYANSVQEICDKYLNLLYIEDYDPLYPNHLTLRGFLSELDDDSTEADLPHNVVFTVRASHDFAYRSAQDVECKLVIYTASSGSSHAIEVALKKMVDTGQGPQEVFLENGDFRSGKLYHIYINSQNHAIISASDIDTLDTRLTAIEAAVNSLSTSQTIATLASTTATIETVNATDLTLTHAITLPNGTTTSTQPANDNSTKVATTAYVDRQVAAKLEDYHNKYHIFGTGNPDEVLAEAEEKAIYFKF